MRTHHQDRRTPDHWTFVYGGRALTLALLLTLLLLLAGVRPLLLAWLAGASVTALLVYGYDKLAAQTGRFRIPERVLLLMALLGGSLGAILGMLLFRHKTHKGPFLAALAAVLVAQLAALLLWRRFLT